MVFLAHPTTLSSAFAHWGDLTSLVKLVKPGGGGRAEKHASWEARWEEQAWMRVVSPLVWVYSIVWARVSPLVCDPYLFMDQFEYGPLGTQVWLSRAFGWQFLASPRMAERNIEASLRAADARGVRVFGLGALNKAEFINGSGQRLVDAVAPRISKCFRFYDFFL